MFGSEIGILFAVVCVRVLQCMRSTVQYHYGETTDTNVVYIQYRFILWTAGIFSSLMADHKAL